MWSTWMATWWRPSSFRSPLTPAWQAKWPGTSLVNADGVTITGSVIENSVRHGVNMVGANNGSGNNNNKVFLSLMLKNER